MTGSGTGVADVHAVQPALFEVGDQWPEGWRYEAGFLSAAEEDSLLGAIASLPLQQAEYKQFVARRRVVSYGGRYDFAAQHLREAPPIPEWLYPLRDRAAVWAGLKGDRIAHALISEYAPGTPLGWHRDVPEFEAIIGVSLLGSARMRFRRYPPRTPGRAECYVDLDRRSIYTLQGAARWGWQHSVSPTKELRYSITFRTRRGERE
jgi:alkylated DNA repair dioxygenase AlkB